MKRIKMLTLSSVALVATLTYSQTAQAEGLTGREFSSWSQSGQDNYISISIVMASFISGRIDQAKVRCIDAWYFDDPRGVAARNAELRTAIIKFGEYHPSATLLALVQKTCGNFGG